MYCIVLYCIVLYCIVLYCIVLYCIVLYCGDNVPEKNVYQITKLQEKKSCKLLANTEFVFL